MAKISVYPTISSPLGDDILIGTDIHHQDATKNFMISDMFAIGLETSVTKLKIYDPTLFGYGEISLDNDVFKVKGAPTNTRNLLMSSATGYLSFKKNNYDVKLDATSVTDNRTYTLPNTDGHVALVETTTLQQVTDNGDTTTDDIFVNRLGIYDDIFEGYANIQSRDLEFNFLNASGLSVFDIKETGVTIKNTSNSRYGLINPALITDYRNHLLPDKSGTFALTSDLRPYKVFTALLTQSGGDMTSGLNAGNLTLGVTYVIEDNSDGLDMTNVGAPNNTVGTYFLATGTTPNSWGSGGLVFNTGAPVATVLENTIGNIWFTYYSPGIYNIYSNGLFTANKTFMELSNVTDITNNSSGLIFVGFGLIESDSNLKIQSDAFTDGDMYNTPIEIRVYS